MFRAFPDPQAAFSNFQDSVGRALERMWHAGVSTGPFDGQAWGPVIDVFERETDYLLFAEVPGVAGDEVEVTVNDGVLTIRGEKARPEGVREGAQPVRSERRYGTFCRAIELPPGIDHEALGAECKHGTLTITIPKTASARPRSVKVKAADGAD